MSVKIFEGKFINDISTFHELHERVEEMRTVCRNVALEDASEMLAEFLSYMIDKDNNEEHDINWVDHFTKGNIKEDHSYGFLEKFIYSKAYLADNKFHLPALIFLIELLDERRAKIKETNMRDPLFDFDLTINFYSLKDKIVFIPDCERSSILNEAVRVLGGKDYGYWDNTDAPEDLTEEEWEQRREDWKKAVLDKNIHPAGFTVDLWGDYDYLMELKSGVVQEESEGMQRILGHIPTDRERAEKLAYDKVVNKCMQNKMAGKSSEFSTMDILDVKDDCRAYLKSDEGKKELEKEIEGYDIQEINGEVLRNKKIQKPKVENEPEET